jgi:hypothetical protein
MKNKDLTRFVRAMLDLRNRRSSRLDDVLYPADGSDMK